MLRNIFKTAAARALKSHTQSDSRARLAQFSNKSIVFSSNVSYPVVLVVNSEDKANIQKPMHVE